MTRSTFRALTCGTRPEEPLSESRSSGWWCIRIGNVLQSKTEIYHLLQFTSLIRTSPIGVHGRTSHLMNNGRKTSTLVSVHREPPDSRSTRSLKGPILLRETGSSFGTGDLSPVPRWTDSGSPRRVQGQRTEEGEGERG